MACNVNLKQINADISLFELLEVVGTGYKNKEVLEMIISLKKKIQNMVDATLTVEEQNVLDNDVVTLNELIHEYKDELYSCYPVTILSLLTNFNDADKVILKDLFLEMVTCNKEETLRFTIKNNLAYFQPSLKEQIIKEMDKPVVSKETYEQIVVCYKRVDRMKELDATHLAYLKVIAAYCLYVLEDKNNV